ncbi:C40 family peptidase [Neisseria sp. Marseille-Q6792]|uniref:C40 family peptidase n=1 Tax=Neisseria sp. Marseille-Q6792 TaxID=2937985 RepID=UPI0020243227|nr:C40 family peptidase [Neisseria sp. Marseille-Q6792]
MDSFFKPAVWAVLWLVFAVRPALADELTNLLSSREQILRQFAENGQYAQTARTNNDRTSGSADELIGNAMGLLGVAYRYGGTSVSTGFDCSGFMQHIFKRAMGINLPRTSAEQAQMGTPVARSELQPGDMVFFRTLGGSRISHVGLYIGNDRFIHAPRTGKNIEITSLSHKYWSGKYAFARRVKKNDPSRFLN